MPHAPTKVAGFALALAGMALGAAAPAGAATPATWSCRGSAVETQLAGNPRSAPFATDRTPCADSTVGLPNTGQAAGVGSGATAQTAYAVTGVTPRAAAPKDQTVGAMAGVEGLEAKAPDGSVVIGVDAARSSASASCQAGVPELTGTSSVARLRVNGQEVTGDGPVQGVLDPVSGSPLAAVVQVRFDEQVKTATGITQRAAHVVVLSAAGATPLYDVVIAESKLASASACDPSADGNAVLGISTTSAGGPGAFPNVCPEGSSLDLERAVCVIPAERSGGQGVVVVGVPYSGPSGGRVLSLTQARKRYKSPCLSGSGPRFAVVGTKRADRITGTNRADRILGLGGNDAIDGGRLDDCIDGGTGADNLAGGIGKDRVYGMSGRDSLNGGPGTDRLVGGMGNDTINAAFGQDRVSGGPGVDFVNVATAGKPARVDCGPGRDKVRFNRNERHHVRGCETKHELRD